ncbi:AAA family ATPase [Faucicola boevrei]|uniref:AAA family ATPase n=1 Tax=Faucicola boevrei TaxID=346665 RepID=UPI00037E3871|nr:AAA family ATPase [Moraxella boevrei]
MAKLDKLTVKGFKSIKSLENFELTNLNVLIGANGAGKSNFIGIFRLLNNIYHQNLQLYVKKQGGVDSFLHFGRENTEKISITVSFPITIKEFENFYEYDEIFKDSLFGYYTIDLSATNDNRMVFDSEYANFLAKMIVHQGHFESELSKSEHIFELSAKNAIQSWKIYHFHDTSDTAKVKRQSAINDNLVLKADGENLSAYLYMLNDKYPNEYQRIVNTIRLVLPFFDEFVIRKNVELVELEWFQKGQPDTPLKAHLLSDGSLRFTCLMVLLLQPLELLPDTILIDEPELGLHPYAIAILADVIKQVAEKKQVIISTQSVTLVNYFEPNDVIVVNQKDGVSSFERLDNEKLADWLEDYSLGELWETNLLGGRP